MKAKALFAGSVIHRHYEAEIRCGKNHQLILAKLPADDFFQQLSEEEFVDRYVANIGNDFSVEWASCLIGPTYELLRSVLQDVDKGIQLQDLLDGLYDTKIQKRIKLHLVGKYRVVVSALGEEDIEMRLVAFLRELSKPDSRYIKYTHPE